MGTDFITEQAFKEMVERMRPRLMQLGRSFFHDEELAEDAVPAGQLAYLHSRDNVDRSGASSEEMLIAQTNPAGALLS